MTTLLLESGPCSDSAPSTSPFWPALGRGLLRVGKTLLSGMSRAGQVISTRYQAIDPHVRQQLRETPWLGLTQLAPRRTPSAIPRDDGQRLVIFIHGLAGSRGNLLPMQACFRMMGRSRTISIGFGQASSIEEMARSLQWQLLTLVSACGLPEGRVVDLVGHSMGGLVARLALEEPCVASRVANLVTLGTPHQGTELARFLQTPAVVAMRPGSDLLTRLESQLPWPGRPHLPDLTCFWSPSDVLLMPVSSGAVPGAHNIALPGFTHLSFVLKPRAFGMVLNALEPADLEVSLPSATEPRMASSSAI